MRNENLPYLDVTVLSLLSGFEINSQSVWLGIFFNIYICVRVFPLSVETPDVQWKRSQCNSILPPSPCSSGALVPRLLPTADSDAGQREMCRFHKKCDKNQQQSGLNLISNAQIASWFAGYLACPLKFEKRKASTTSQIVGAEKKTLSLYPRKKSSPSHTAGEFYSSCLVLTSRAVVSLIGLLNWKVYLLWLL